MTDCLCGSCSPCRRALRDHTRRTPAPTVLSDRVRAILAEPVGTEYQPAYLPVQEPKPAAGAKRPSRARTTDRPVPTTYCDDCHQWRAPRRAGKSMHGLVPSGRDGLCDVCADRDYITTKLDDPATDRYLRRKLRLRLGRVLKDGRAFHPDAPHASSVGYGNYGCRCTDCSTWKSEDSIRRREARAARA